MVVNVDGGSRGNPGPAAIGVVVQDADGGVLEEVGERIGDATNNVAEYRALLLGIERALALGATELELVGDSELIVRQVKGEYKVKDATLRELHAEVKRALVPLRELVDPPRPPRAQRRGRPPRQRGARWLRATNPIDPGVDIGHVHLKVADLDRALDFYCGVLGFELQQRIGDEAAFVSAGGYHHHIGLNTWHSRGGSPPPPGHAPASSTPRSATRPAAPSPTPCAASARPESPSAAPPTTASARRSTSTTPTATGSSSTGTARARTGTTTRTANSTCSPPRSTSAT